MRPLRSPCVTTASLLCPGTLLLLSLAWEVAWPWLHDSQGEALAQGTRMEGGEPKPGGDGEGAGLIPGWQPAEPSRGQEPLSNPGSAQTL